MCPEASKSVVKRWKQPKLTKRRQLRQVLEGGGSVVTDGEVNPKGGCFKNRK